MDNCSAKQTFGKFDVFQNPSETGQSITSETDAFLLTGLSCTSCMVYDNVLKFILFPSATKGDSTSVNMML